MIKKLTIIRYLIFTILFIIPINAYAYDYEINKYDINVEVLENNVMNITESLEVYFNVPKHGIYRKIPLRNKVKRLDGSYTTNRAVIKDINVNEQYSLSNSSGYKVIKIGNPDEELTGKKNYTISYSYDLGKDKMNNYDELYLNLIGTDWDTSISGISFKITMPKEFDSEKLGFSSGVPGSTDNSNISYEVDGNLISGYYNGNLNPGEALTVRVELPEDYFVGENNNTDPIIISIILLSVFFVLLSIFLWYIFGRDDQVIDTVEFYPPDGLNSLDVGLLYKSKADKNDVVSLLLYLANKGYISIKEAEISKNEIKAKYSVSSSHSLKGFIIKKEKNYDGNNESEKKFLDGLFKKIHRSGLTLNQYIGDSSNSTDEDLLEVSEFDLINSFYITLNEILRGINSKKNRSLYFEKSSLDSQLLIKIMISISFVLSIFLIVYTGDVYLILPFLFFTTIYFTCIGTKDIKGVIITVCMMLLFISFPIVVGILSSNFSTIVREIKQLLAELDYYNILIMFCPIVSILVMHFIHKHILKRNVRGNELFGKIKVFKNFLETSEKEKLEALVNDNPTYFYDILPFTYVLGISDMWINKFESIAIEAPDWYDGSSTFSMSSFGSFMNSTMTSASTAMTSSPSSSGGGSSGGGSGGGGGGSW